MATKLRNAEATISEQAESAATMPVLQGEIKKKKKKKNNNLSYIADGDKTSPTTSALSRMSSSGTSEQATILSDQDIESPVSQHLQDTMAATPLVPGDDQDIEVPVKNSISTATTFPLQSVQGIEAAINQSSQVSPLDTPLMLSGQDKEDPEESQPHQGTLTNASPLLRQLRVDRGHTYMQIAMGNEGRKILKKPRKIKRTTSEQTSLLPNIGISKHQTSFTHGYQIHPGHRYSNVKVLSSAVSIVTGAKSENFRKKLMLIIRSRVQKSRDGDDQVPYPLPNDPTFMDGFVYGVLFSFVLVFVSYFYISWV